MLNYVYSKKTKTIKNGGKMNAIKTIGNFLLLLGTFVASGIILSVLGLFLLVDWVRK